MRKLVIGLMAVLLLALAATPALAVERREGTRITVAANETVRDDMVVSGESVVIDGVVEGDVFAFANSIQVRGTIKGNLIAAGNQIDIDGHVTGTALTAANNIYVNGNVDGNLVSASSTATLKGAVGRNWIGAGDKLFQNGKVERGMLTAGSTIDVAGPVGQEIEATAANLTIRSNSTVGGKVILYGNRPATVENGAHTGEVIFHQSTTKSDFTFNWQWRALWTGAKFVGFMLVGLLALALFPGLRRSFPDLIMAKPWQLPLAGFVAMVVFPIGTILVLFTVIGIPLSLLAMLLFPVAIYVSQVFVAWSVAKLLGDRVSFMKDWSWPLLFLAGALLTTILVSVPGIGSLFATASLLYGLGGVVYLTVFRNRTPAI